MISRREQTASYVILFVFSAIAVWPIVAIVLLAFNPPGTLTSGVALPKVWSLDSFAKAWNEGGFGPALANSFIVAFAVVFLAVLMSMLAAYAFGTMRFRGSRALFYYLLIGIMIPYQATIVPLYFDLRTVHLTNTYWALILPQAAFSVSFGTFWMRAFFRNYPTEIIEAARTDGANTWQILWRVIAPSTAPAVLALSLILFIWTWNDLMIAIVMIQNPSLQMAPQALAFFAGAERGPQLPVVAAAAILVALPVILMYVVLQRRYVEGVVAGAING
jgi:raffinose/stachyose/melibiose transport system permease protein